MSYDDYADGQRLASSGSSPDWNNQDQADGYRAAKLAEDLQSRYVPPPSSSTTDTSSWDSTPAWEPAPSWQSSSPAWTPGSSGGGGTTAPVSGKGLAKFMVALAGMAGGWMGYGYGQARHWSGVQAWAATGGGALGAALTAAAILLVIVGTVMAMLYVIKGLVIATSWLAVKVFWLVIIVGGLSVAGWAITAASCRWLGLCRLFLDFSVAR